MINFCVLNETIVLTQGRINNLSKGKLIPFMTFVKRLISSKVFKRKRQTWIIGTISVAVIGCGTSLLLIPENRTSEGYHRLRRAQLLQRGKQFLSNFLPISKIDESFNDFEEWRTSKEVPWAKDEDEGTSSWFKWLFPWESSRSDSPWVLLDLTRSPNYWVRQVGVAALAGKTHWDEHKYRYVAQCVSPRTAVALARYPHCDPRYFLPPPSLVHDDTPIVEALQQLVSGLPAPPRASVLSFYRSLALAEELPSKKDPLTLDLDVTPPVFTPEDEAERHQHRGVMHCLKAIQLYTQENGYARQFVQHHGLATLQKLYGETGDPAVHETLASILNNLSQHPDLLATIQRTGWLWILRHWCSSPSSLLALLALTALANLDTDWQPCHTYQDVVLLHPTARCCKPAVCDIVLVHGLQGGAVKTWRQMDGEGEGVSQCWPKDWLASEFPNTRILSIGYATDVLRWGDYCPYDQDKRTLEGRAKELIKKLQQAGVGTRPVIWVGHSMGGLLIKQMLYQCEADPAWRDLCDLRPATRGLVMYSVPHLGSPLADRLMMARYLLLPSPDVMELVSYSVSLQRLHQGFMQSLKHSPMALLSFGETQETEFASALPPVLIVPRSSSDIGVGKYIPLPTNHIDTCKPRDRNDPSYTELVAFIRGLLADIDRSARGSSPEVDRSVEDRIKAFVRDTLSAVNRIGATATGQETAAVKDTENREDGQDDRGNEKAKNDDTGVKDNLGNKGSSEVDGSGDFDGGTESKEESDDFDDEDDDNVDDDDDDDDDNGIKEFTDS